LGEPADGERKVTQLLARAAWMQTLGLALTWPGPGHVDAVNTALGRLPELGVPALDEVLSSVRSAWAVAPESIMQGEYIRLFSGSGPCPPHETCYGDGRRLGGPEVELADISGFHKAFGMEPSGPIADAPDHLASELEFLSCLLIKTAYAGANGWDDRQRVTHDASRAFCEYHLGRWVGAFREAVEAARAISPYTQTARAIEALVQAECMRTGAQPLPVRGRAPVSPAEPIICPFAARGE
jgi:TorA maturation chaperone TorD